MFKNIGKSEKVNIKLRQTMYIDELAIQSESKELKWIKQKEY